MFISRQRGHIFSSKQQTSKGICVLPQRKKFSTFPFASEANLLHSNKSTRIISNVRFPSRFSDITCRKQFLWQNVPRTEKWVSCWCLLQNNLHRSYILLVYLIIYSLNHNVRNVHQQGCRTLCRPNFVPAASMKMSLGRSVEMNLQYDRAGISATIVML